MSRRSRAAQKLAAQKEKEELARKKAAEAGQTKHLSKYAAKKLAQLNAAQKDDYSEHDYTPDAESSSSSSSADAAAESSAGSERHDAASRGSSSSSQRGARTRGQSKSGSRSGRGGERSTQSGTRRNTGRVQSTGSGRSSGSGAGATGGGDKREHIGGKLTAEQISAKVTRVVSEAIPNSSSTPQRRKIRAYQVQGGTVLRSSVETPEEQARREHKEARLRAEEARLPAKVRESRMKHRQHKEDVKNARLRALEELEARGETYKQPYRKDQLPDKITFNRDVVNTCGIETKDRMPDLNDPLERQAALAPHNRRDTLLFAPIKRHNKPISGTDFMAKFLDRWEERMDKGGIFQNLFTHVKQVRRHENGIAYIGLPAFLKFLEGTSKRNIIDEYAFDFHLYIKRREITDFIASMKGPALAWMAHRHPMDQYYAFVYMDTYPVRIKLGKKRVYVEQELFLIGVTLDGRKDLLGIIPDFTAGRLSVDFWERILEHFKLLGTRDICFMVAGFKCRYLERAVKKLFPNTTLQFNLLEVLQFDSFQLPTELRKSFMEDAAALCDAPNFEVAKAKLDLMRDKWEPMLPEGYSVLQGNIDLLKVHTYLSPEDRKIFTTHKMIATAATLLLGNKDTQDFFSDHAEMLNYFFYRYLLIAKPEWLERQDYAIYNLTFSHLFALLRHSDIAGGELLNELLNEQHQDFMYRHFGRFGTGPVFNLNPNRRKISLSGQIEPFRNLQQVWGDELSESTASKLQEEQIEQQAAAEALRQKALEQAKIQYEKEQQAAAATLAAAAQGAAATAAAIAQASHIEATAISALGGINSEQLTSAAPAAAAAAAFSYGVRGAIAGTTADAKFEGTPDPSGLKLGDAALPAFLLNDAKTLNLQTATQNALQPKLRVPRSHHLTHEARGMLAVAAAEEGNAGDSSTELSQNLRTNECLSSSYAPEQSSRPASWSKLGTKDSYRQAESLESGDYYLDTERAPDQFNTLHHDTQIAGLENMDRTYGVQELDATAAAAAAEAAAGAASAQAEAKDGADAAEQGTSYMQVKRPEELQPYGLEEENSGLINRYGAYTMDMDGTDGEKSVHALDEFEALAPRATAPSAYLMNNVSSNIQSANAVLGMLKPSIAQALRADRQELKRNERQQILNCLGGNFNFDPMDNVIHQVTPIFRSAMQTKINWYANHKKEEEAAARAKEKAKARARYLKRQEAKANALAEIASHQPVKLDAFTPLQSIHDLGLKHELIDNDELVQEISLWPEQGAFSAQGLEITRASPNTSTLGSIASGNAALGSHGIQGGLSSSLRAEGTGFEGLREERADSLMGFNQSAIGTTLEVDFAQQQLRMQPVLGEGQEVLQIALQNQSNIKVAPNLMTSLISTTEERESQKLSLRARELDVTTGQIKSRRQRLQDSNELSVDPNKSKLSLAPDLLQMSTQNFDMQGNERLLHHSKKEVAQEVEAKADQDSAMSGDQLHIEKTTDFDGPVPAPAIRSLIAETLATPAGVKTATLDPMLKLKTDSGSGQ